MRLASRSCFIVATAFALVVGVGAPRPVAAGSSSAIRLDGQPVTVTGVDLHGAGQVDPDRLGAEVARLLERYLAIGVIKGVSQGRPGAGVPELFTARARPRLAGEDRSTLVEEGGPRPAVVRTDRSRARLVALVGPSGRVEVVVATIDHRLHGWGGAAGTLRLLRRGDLVLNHTSAGWRIDAYDLDVERRRDPLPPVGALLWLFGEEGS